MLVKLNCFRDGANPGDVVDVDDNDAAALIAHGTAFAHDDLDVALDAAEAQGKAGRIVKGEAALEVATGTGDDSP